LKAEPVDLKSVIEEALDSVRLSAETKNVALGTTFDSEAGQVTGDAARLQQVIWNLLSNAIKFTPAGGRVDIELRRAAAHLQIEVRDTGKGISPDFLPQVFQQFSQAETTSERTGGLGLGLSLVKGLVEAHGGEVAVASAGVGKGSTFIVRLPVRAVQSALPTQPLSAQHLAGHRVLVVDDTPDARDLVATALGLSGAEVTTASSAVEALARLGAGEVPELIVSDLCMPEMDGYEFIRRVQELPATKGGRIPMIALTARADTNDRKKALSAGFHVYLSKPVELEKLTDAITDVLLGRSESREF
jgi:CheY-like chemotaxis protein/anti-sigma regulatory factor (Ser/Thr protein kinase)